MSDGFNLDRARLKELRWRILKVLEAGRPVKVRESLIHLAITDADLEASPQEIRRELDYLRDHQLVEIAGEGTPTWTAALTGLGVDVVEYSVDAPPGVARPARW